MGRKLTSFRLPKEIAQKLEDLVKTGKYSSVSFILSKALEQFFDSLERKEEEKPPAPAEDLRPQLEEALREVERLKDVLRKDAECFSRIEDNKKLYCAKNAPKIVELKIVELPTLKICRACKSKLTKEALEKEIPQIHYYYTCGAIEKFDEGTKTAFLSCKSDRCHPELKGRWHTMQQCNAVGCPLLKSYYTKRK